MGIVAVAVHETSWFRALLYILIATVLARVVGTLLKRRDTVQERLTGRSPDPSERTRYTMIRRLIVATILFVGVAIALLQFRTVGAIAQTMLASAAILAAILGIAARAPIANLVSGVMIAFSQPVRLNDYISVGDVEGIVEKISLTYTFIRTTDEGRVVIPNEVFASQTVQNYSLSSPHSTIVIDLELPPDAAVETASERLLALADAVAPPPEGCTNSVEVASLRLSSTALRLHAWAPNPKARTAVAGELRRQIQRRLREDRAIAPASGADSGEARSEEAGGAV